MVHVLPLIQDNTLMYRQDGQDHVLLVDTPDWFLWLNTASSFHFSSEDGSFTARKERAGNRRGSWYWKAYRRHGGKLYSHYMSTSEHLSLEYLNAVAAVLAEKRGIAPMKKLRPSPLDHNAHEMITSTDDLEHTLRASPIPKGGVPIPLTSLIGREQQVETLCSFLRRPSTRLVTLIGPGGVGKTHLALQVAAEICHDFADNVFFVPLAAVSDPRLVIPTIAKTLGLREVGDHTLLEQLQTYLRKQRLLLLLDNFEQVLSAAPYLAHLLAFCPHLQLLVTSRAALHIHGEYEFAVEPLAVPDLQHLPERERLVQMPTMALFLERVRAIQPDFQLTPSNVRTIAEICVRLDGLPLAIELAAAHMKLYPPQALLTRLSHRLEVLTSGACDLPVRQQTLRNTLQWSYDLLSKEEQCLFRQLSIFVGGCTLEAAVAVVQRVDNPSGDLAKKTLEGFASLLDKSLLHQTEREGDVSRLSMLETIREYGLACLQERGELETMRWAHAMYYLRLTEKAVRFLFCPDAMIWLERMEREHENVRAALQWTLECEGKQTGSGIEIAVRLSNALWPFWTTRGYLSEGSTFTEQILPASERSDSSIRVQALHVSIMLAWYQEDYARLEGLCEEQLLLCQQLGDRQHEAPCLFSMAGIALHTRNYTLSHALAEQAVVISRETGDASVLAPCLMFLGRLAFAQGDYSRAEELLKESLTLHRTNGHRADMVWSLLYLARNAIIQGAYERAQTLLEEALAFSREMGYKWGSAHALGFLGREALEQSDTVKAYAYLTESLRLNQEVGNQRSVAWSLFLLASVLTMQGEMASAQSIYEQSLTIAIALQHRGLIASCLEGLAMAATRQGQPIKAGQLWGAAETVQQGKILSIPQVIRVRAEQARIAACTQLGPERFAAALAEGRTMAPEQAISLQEPTTALPLSTARQRQTAPTPSAWLGYSAPARLTAREREVLRLVAQGLTDAQVSKRLGISYRTTTSHVTSIYNKLGINSRAAATRFAIEYHLL